MTIISVSFLLGVTECLLESVVLRGNPPFHLSNGMDLSTRVTTSKPPVVFITALWYSDYVRATRKGRQG